MSYSHDIFQERLLWIKKITIYKFQNNIKMLIRLYRKFNTGGFLLDAFIQYIIYAWKLQLQSTWANCNFNHKCNIVLAIWFQT